MIRGITFFLFFLKSELRDQLRKARLDEERTSNQLQKTKAKVAKLEVDLVRYAFFQMKQYNLGFTSIGNKFYQTKAM